MLRAFIADSRDEERSALSLVLSDLQLKVVGESVDWATTLAQLPSNDIDVLVVDWDILPPEARASLDALRKSRPGSMAVILISRHDARQQAAISSGADEFVSTGELAERVVDRLRSVAAGLQALDTASDIGP